MDVNVSLVIVTNIYPELDGGKYYMKRCIGETFHVEADIFTHGHNVIKARLLYRIKGEKKWS